MSDILGIKELMTQFKKLLIKSKLKDDVAVIVGYTANYALFVHENLEARHPVGQAKFLEQPARQNAKEYAAIIKTGYRRTGTLLPGLLLAGLRLQRDSQKLVPIDTGNLKGSAFTRKE